MGLIQNVLAVIVVLGLLITFHEFGHYWVARRCGVRVLRFSVGFGKAIWSRTDRHGTEFVVAAIPLGGYVKMLDEREAPVPDDQLHETFNRKTVWQRIAIVAAGPLANFLLAIVAYWALFVAGTTTVAPVVGEVAPDSPAARSGLQSGQEIVSVQGNAVRSWDEINLRLIAHIGASGELTIDARDDAGSSAQEYRLPVENYLVRQDPPQPLATLGITPWQPRIPAVLGQVLDGQAAAEAGLQPGDEVLAVNGAPIGEWMDFVSVVRANPGETLELEVQRDGEPLTVTLTPGSRELETGGAIGYVGAGVEPVEWPEEFRREYPLRSRGRLGSGRQPHRRDDGADAGCDPQDAGRPDLADQSFRTHHHRSDGGGYGTHGAGDLRQLHGLSLHQSGGAESAADTGA